MRKGMSFAQFLTRENRAGRAVPAFNVYGLATIRAGIRASHEQKIPVILALGEKYFVNMTPKVFVQLVQMLAPDYPDAEVWTHLDHAQHPENCIRAMEAGFDSVMIDTSHLPFEENIRATQSVVQEAQRMNVGVEAELGGIGVGAGSHEFSEGKEQFTDPEQAHTFVEQTGVDALAVSIGTVHGFYKGEPRIDVDRLQEIRQVTTCPLVLHGGSGTPTDVLQTCIQRGIAKINVNTELSATAVQQMQQEIQQKHSIHLSELDLVAEHAVYQVMCDYISRFRSASTALNTEPEGRM